MFQGEAVNIGPFHLTFLPDRLKTKGMCKRVVEKYPYSLECVPDHFKTGEMYLEAVHKNPYTLRHVPDQFKTKEICNKAVKKNPSSLQYVPDYFLMQQQVKLWRNNSDFYYRLIEWYEGHKKRKAQKASIKEELMPIVWHPSTWWDWCVPEDEKKETEKLWA